MRSCLRTVLLVLSITGSFPWLGSAHAQTSAAPVPADSEEYVRLIDAAVSEYEAHSFEEARALFLRAHELSPNARTLRGIALAEFELKNYGECVKRLEAALVSEVKPLDAELRKEALELLDRARGYVARVVVHGSPSKGQLLVDGFPVQPDEDQTVLLSVGEHVLEMQAAGYTSERRALRIRGGEQHELKFELARVPGFERRDTPQPWYKNRWLWTGVGIAVVGAGAAAGFLLRPEDRTVQGEPATTQYTPEGSTVVLGASP